jgi:putative FmdB family regulatory protein
MPIFDFACQDCGKKFDLMISNQDKHKAKCPECGSSQIKQLVSLFSTSSGVCAHHADHNRRTQNRPACPP